MTMPDFFILGAPKCGTTALAHWLGEHPQVFMSPIKEPHYFSTDLANRTITARRQYEKLFRGAGSEHKAAGEASTWYLYSQEAVPNIEQVCPDARHIVMTRDPVEMAQSLYHHNYRVLYEDQPTFEQAWAMQEARGAGRAIPEACIEPAFLQYKAACSLGHQLRRLLDQVPSERVLHVALEDVQTDPAQQYRRVLKFLGVSDDGRESFPVLNKAGVYRSRTLQGLFRLGGRMRRRLGFRRGTGLRRLNERPAIKQVLSKSFREELEKDFAADYELLSQTGCLLAQPQAGESAAPGESS